MYQTCGHLIFRIVLIILHIHRTRTMIYLLHWNNYDFQVFFNFSPFFSNIVTWLRSNFQVLAQNLFKNTKCHKASYFEVSRATSQNQRFWKNSHISEFCCLMPLWINFYYPNNEMSTCSEKFEVSKSIVATVYNRFQN